MIFPKKLFHFLNRNNVDGVERKSAGIGFYPRDIIYNIHSVNYFAKDGVFTVKMRAPLLVLDDIELRTAGGALRVHAVATTGRSDSALFVVQAGNNLCRIWTSKPRPKKKKRNNYS